jgi:sortase A
LYVLSEQEWEDYHSQLNLTGDGIMGYIEIPSINISLPLHHTVEETILQVAIGHIEWTSLPTGGEGTHTVFSGHRGLPSARLFSDLDQLTPGDLFMLRILDELMTYEVDQILVVEPHEVEPLQVEAGKDLCTLVTCTPYGVNSHRLLVRGHRVENPEDAVTLRVTADAYRIEPLTVAPVVAVPILLVVLWIMGIADRINRRKNPIGKQVDIDE